MSKRINFTTILVCICSLANAQWQQVDGYSANGNATSMIVVNDSMIVSSTGNVYDMTPGLCISTNHGVPWSAKNTNLGTGASPLLTDGGYLYAGTWGQGVYSSTDKGNTWIDKSNGLPSGFPVLDLIIHNTDLYACGTGGIFHSRDNANGVYKSNNYGLNWMNTGCVNAMSLAILPGSPPQSLTSCPGLSCNIR